MIPDEPIQDDGMLAPVPNMIGGPMQFNGQVFVAGLNLFQGTIATNVSITGGSIITFNGAPASGHNDIVAENANLIVNAVAGTITLETTNALRFQVAQLGGCTINNVPPNTNGLLIIAPNTTSESFGLKIEAGTNPVDAPISCFNADGTVKTFTVNGDGSCVVGTAGIPSFGTGTLNAQNGLYSRNSPIILGGHQYLVDDTNNDDGMINYPNIAPNVATFQNGTFVGTLTGVNAVTTGTVSYQISGNVCTLRASSITGTCSTPSAVYLEGLPSVVQATVSQLVPCTVENNGNFAFGAAFVGATSSIQLYVAGTGLIPATGGWTTATVIGLFDWSIVYPLN
jgi:hypothetical protein